MLYNSIPTNSLNACSSIGNCKNCQKRYSCLSYAIAMLERIVGSSQDNNVSNFAKNLENMNMIQLNSQQELAKTLNERISNIEENISNSLTNLENLIKENQSYNISSGVQTASLNVEESAIAPVETGLQPSQKVWKEKKGFFGKSKWVEE